MPGLTDFTTDPLAKEEDKTFYPKQHPTPLEKGEDSSLIKYGAPAQ